MQEVMGIGESGRLESGLWEEAGGTAEAAPHPTGPGSTAPAEQIELLSSMATLWIVGL